MKPLPQDQVSLLVLHTPCQTFLKEVATVIDDFEKKNAANENDQKAIDKIRTLLLPKDEKATPPVNGVTARRVLKEVLRQYYSYLGWRYWSSLPQQLDAIRRKPEFSEMALNNGDYHALLPNFEHTKALTVENGELKEKNHKLVEENSYLKIQAQATDQELLKAWEEKDKVEREKQQLARQHIQALRLAHGWKQAYFSLKEQFEEQVPGIKVTPLPESLSSLESGSSFPTTEVSSQSVPSTASFSFNRSSTYHPELFSPAPPPSSSVPTPGDLTSTLVKPKEEQSSGTLAYNS